MLIVWSAQRTCVTCSPQASSHPRPCQLLTLLLDTNLCMSIGLFAQSVILEPVALNPVISPAAIMDAKL